MLDEPRQDDGLQAHVTQLERDVAEIKNDISDIKGVLLELAANTGTTTSTVAFMRREVNDKPGKAYLAIIALLIICALALVIDFATDLQLFFAGVPD